MNGSELIARLAAHFPRQNVKDGEVTAKAAGLATSGGWSMIH